MVHNPKPSCDSSVRQLKRCYFWEHSVCLSVFCIARMAEETSLPLHQGGHLWKAHWLQSLISSHVTSPPASSCTLHTRGKLCARLHVWANQFDNTKTKHPLVHLVVAAFSGAKTHPPQAGQPVLELALSAETSAIGVNWADRRGAIYPGQSSITKYRVQKAFL